MTRAVPASNDSESAGSPDLINRIAGCSRGLFIALSLVVFVLFTTRFPLSGTVGHWALPLLLVLAISTTVFGMSQRLPFQNVLFAALAITALAAFTFELLEILSLRAACWLAPLPAEVLPRAWLLPLPALALLNARGVAQLILRPFRRNANYGLWLMGATILLTLQFDVSLNPFATQVCHLWNWPDANTLPFGAPWAHFAVVSCCTLSLMPVLTVLLPDKKPVESPASLSPLWVWALLNLLFAVGTATHQNVAATIVTAATLAVIFAAAHRGVNFRPPSRSP